MYGPQSNLSARHAKRLFPLPTGMIGLRTNELVPDLKKRISSKNRPEVRPYVRCEKERGRLSVARLIIKEVR